MFCLNIPRRHRIALCESWREYDSYEHSGRDKQERNSMSKEELIRRVLNADGAALKRFTAAIRGDNPTNPKNEEETRLITITAAARFLAISRQTVYELIKAGRLDTVELSGNRRVTMKSIKLFANGER